MTDLESCVLGVIWRDGPCSAYHVRTVFHRSLTASWRASTGSIYPLVRKLTRLGLLESEPIEGDARSTRSLSITTEGLDELRAWIVGLDSESCQAVPDPVRTRAFFTPVLDDDTRLAFARSAHRHTAVALRSARELVEKYKNDGDAFSACAHTGTVLQLEARLKWLQQLQTHFENTG